MHNRGFTMVEVLLALSILGVVLVIVYGFWQFVSQNYTFSFDQSRSVEDAERSIAYLIREIRQLRVSDTGAYGLVQADDQAITFYADVDGDDQSELVRYFLDGEILKQGIIQPVSSPATYPMAQEKLTYVVEHVVNGTEPIFTYYNGDWPTDSVTNPLTGSSRILATRYIYVQLKIKAGEGPHSPTAAVKSGVALRYLKTNL